MSPINTLGGRIQRGEYSALHGISTLPWEAAAPLTSTVLAPSGSNPVTDDNRVFTFWRSSDACAEEKAGAEFCHPIHRALLEGLRKYSGG